MQAAEQDIFIALSRLLWAFDFEWAKDEQGREMIRGTDKFEDNGIVVCPKEFEVVFSPRKQGLEDMLPFAVKE